MARLGSAGRGTARDRGRCQFGIASCHSSAFPSVNLRGLARSGGVRFGLVRSGMAGLGGVWQGEAWSKGRDHIGPALCYSSTVSS